MSVDEPIAEGVRKYAQVMSLLMRQGQDLTAASDPADIIRYLKTLTLLVSQLTTVQGDLLQNHADAIGKAGELIGNLSERLNEAIARINQLTEIINRQREESNDRWRWN